MARSLKLITLLGWLIAASCTASPNELGEAKQAIIECNGASVGLACDTDDEPCTLEICVQSGQDVTCELQTLANDGTPCVSDGNACTADTCQAGLCENTALPTDTLCDDGLFCTTGSTCNMVGLCQGGTNACDDGDACTTDSCDEGALRCTLTPTPPGGDCNDGDACTDGSTCNAGGDCVGGNTIDCDDGSECTANSCDAILGCVATPLEDSPCSDTFFCTIAEACSIDGTCEGEANCLDGNPCTIDACDELGSSCSNTVDQGAICDDGNQCTESESCTLSGNCVGVPIDNGSTCESEGGCIADGTCDEGNCIGGNQLPDNSNCNDNSACTVSDICTGGACAGYPRNCSDGDACTADGCDEVTGCFNTVIEGCNVGPDAGVFDAGPTSPSDAGDSALDAGPADSDAGPAGILGGGGCNTSGRQGGGDSALLLALAFLLAAAWRRKSAIFILLAICGFSSAARAQGFDTEIFKPGTSATSFLSQESADILPAWTLNVGASLNIARDPLVLRDPETGDALMNGVVVSDRVGGYLTASIGLWDRVELGIAMPMVIRQDGQGALLENSPDLNSGSLGDIRLSAKASLYQKGRVHLAASLATTLPAGDSTALYGEEGLSTTPQLIIGWKRGRARVAVNLGIHFREATQVGDLAIDDEFITGIGGQVEALESRLWLVAEAYSRSALTDPTAERSPAEALVGLRAQLWGPYQIQAGLGAGLGRGYGSPALRGLFGVFYRPQPTAKTIVPEGIPEPVLPKKAVPAPTPTPKAEAKDTDGDGIDDEQDACPDSPEDMDEFEDTDGCPDPDNDGDGILDGDDACPLRAEIVNGVNDTDGCPDEGIITMVQDRVVLGEKVLFDKNRARVKRKGRKALQAIITLYLQHPEWGVMAVEGHADSRGPADFNMSLSRRRADRVRHEMIALGMPADKITSEGLGETVPLIEGESERAMQTNRRVEFVIHKELKQVEERILEPAPVTTEAAPASEP